MTFVLMLLILRQEKSIKYKSSKLWNALPIDMKDVSSENSFEHKLKEHLLQSSEKHELVYCTFVFIIFDFMFAC